MTDADKRESLSISDDSGKPKLKRGRPKAKNPLAVDIKVRLTAEQARNNTQRARAVRSAVLDMIEK